MLEQNYELKGIFAVIITAFLWSIAGLLIKFVDFNPFLIAGLRSLIAGLFLIVWMRKITLKFTIPMVSCALANTFTMLLFIYANKNTTSANAIFIQYAASAFTCIFGIIFLKEKPKAENWISLVFVIFGMSIFFLDKLNAGNMMGNIAAVGSAISFSLYIVFMRMQKDASPLEANVLSHIITACIALPIGLFLGLPETIKIEAVLAILVLGIVQIGIACIFFSYGIKRVTAVQAILLSVIEPVFNPVWVFLSTGEKPSINALLGGAIILISVSVGSVVTVNRKLKITESLRE